MASSVPIFESLQQTQNQIQSPNLPNLLLRECTKILESREFSDTEILVGKAPNDKVFRLHSLVLKICSPYFRTALSDSWVKIENKIIKYKIPNISVNIFDIIIKCIYTGKLELTNNDVKTNVALLIAADEFLLNSLCNFIEDHLLRDKESLKQNFVLIQEVANKFTQFKELSQFYRDSFQQDPSLIFKADDFTTIKQEDLLDLIKNHHSLEPIEIWDKLVEWAVAQSRELTIGDISDVTKWTADNKSTFGNLIQKFIPHINFKGVSPLDFFHKIKLFKYIFDDKFYIKILEDYSFDYTDVHPNLISLFCRIIKLAEHGSDNLAEGNIKYLYRFKSLVRGSTNGFDCKTFHEYCDNKGPTITIAFVKNSDIIIGGYNPYSWNDSCKLPPLLLKSPFIFHLNLNNLTNFSCDQVRYCNSSLNDGPEFVGIGRFFKLLCSNTNKAQYSNMLNPNELFEIDDYEVFQIYKKSN